MTWVRLDDSMTEHPKVAALSNAAFRLHIEGLCYSARTLSDGFIPTPIARRMLASGAPKAAAELVDAGVWESDPNGYLVHDFLEYQPSREKVMSLREVRSQAGRKGGRPPKQPESKPETKPKASGKLFPETPGPSPTVEPPNPGSTVVGSANADPPLVDPPANRPLRDHVEQVWAEYRQRHPTAVFTTARRQLIQRRLADYPWTILVTAIRGNHLDPHCNGENDRGRQYHSIELCLRDAAHIEQYAAIASPNGDGPTGESRLARSRRRMAELEEGRA